MPGEDLTKMVTDATKAVGDVVSKVDGLATSLETLKTEQTTLKDGLKTQSDLIKSIKTSTDKPKSIKEQVKSQIASDDFKTAIKNRKDFEFVLKDNGGTPPVDPADVGMFLANYANAPHMLSQMVMPGYGATHIPAYQLIAALSKGTTSARTIYYIDEVAYDWTDTTRDVIPERGAKPPVKTEFEEHSVTLIKFANSTRVSSEALWDADYITSTINNILLRDLMRQIEWSFILGSGNTNFQGLTGHAASYTATDLDGTLKNPGTPQAILATALWMQLRGFDPSLVVMSPEMYMQMQLLQDDNGNLIGQQALALLSRFQIIQSTRFSKETADAVNKGDFFVVDPSRYNAFSDGAITIRAGFNADDFATNQQTFVAEQRWLDFMYKRDEGAIVKGNVDTMASQLVIV